MSDNKELRYKLSLQDLFSKKMQGAVDQTKRMDSTMSGLGTRIAGVAAGLGLGALAKEMVSTGAKFDSYKLQLETLLGSQRLAADAFNQIKADAAKTPFDVESLTRANSMLISAGASAGEARETVLGLGNAIAATGGGSDELMRMSVNLQQIKTLGKASAMDVKQFAFAGIPIYQMLAKTMGITVEKARTLDVTYEQLKMAFEKSAAAGGMFAGGLEKQSKSIGGQISNLKDQFTNTLVEFYDKLKPAIASIISGLSKMLGWVSRNKETVILFGKIALAIGGVVVAVKAWTFASGIATTAMSAMTTANAALNLSLGTTLGTVGLLAAGIAALGVAIYGAISSYQELQSIQSGIAVSNPKKVIDDEINSVNALADSYNKMGMSREKAMMSAIQYEKKQLAQDIRDAQSRLGSATTDEGRLAAKNKLNELSLQGRTLNDQSNYLISSYSQGKSLASAKGGRTGGGSSSSAGSSTEISATRPQSIVINIGKMVETFELHSTNVSEGFDKIKQKLGNMLAEVANDGNNAALNS